MTTEELAEREKAKSARRQNRCPDYPGLAFGAAMGFGSDTMMKFNIIKNELHNIMRSQLKRVDGEARVGARTFRFGGIFAHYVSLFQAFFFMVTEKLKA